MFKTFINAFKIKEVRNKLLFTFLMLLIIRLGCQVSAPGVDQEFVQSVWGSLFGEGAEGMGVVNAFTGGSLLQMSIFCLKFIVICFTFRLLQGDKYPKRKCGAIRLSGNRHLAWPDENKLYPTLV